MFRVPPDTDNVPLMTESSVSVSAPLMTEMFSFENRLLTTNGPPVLRTVIVRSPA
jgi:hypothetical protein